MYTYYTYNINDSCRVVHMAETLSNLHTRYVYKYTLV